MNAHPSRVVYPCTVPQARGARCAVRGARRALARARAPGPSRSGPRAWALALGDVGARVRARGPRAPRPTGGPVPGTGVRGPRAGDGGDVWTKIQNFLEKKPQPEVQSTNTRSYRGVSIGHQPYN